MASVINKQVCECCGQVINTREVALYRGMVAALVRLYVAAKAMGKNEFTRAQIKQILKSENDTARWGDWILFGAGMVYKPNGKGSWGINLDRVAQFIRGELKVPLKVLKTGKSLDVQVVMYGTINDVPSMTEFLNENNQYIAKYI